MAFSKVRYAQKTKEGVIYRNLNSFAQENPDNSDFIRKYLTLTKCDLFFADKAILVEGASERLLIPDMIDKCNKSGDFSSQKYKLPAQYYTIIEIGGAYAYKFIPFIEFLGIPCLILTDVDSVLGQEGKNGQIYYKSVPVSCGETTSNETLKWWVRKNKGLSNDDKTQIDLADIISMSSDDKTRGKCHIEFQTKENELCGHSLEEAIRNVNRSHYGLSDRRVFSDKYPLILIDEYQDSYKPIIERFIKYFIAEKKSPQFAFFGDAWQTIYQSNKACGIIEHKNLEVIKKGANFRSSPRIVQLLNDIRPDLPQTSAIDNFQGEVVVITCEDYDGERRTDRNFQGELPPEELKIRLNKIFEEIKQNTADSDTLKILMITHKVLAAQQGYERLLSIINDTVCAER